MSRLYLPRCLAWLGLLVISPSITADQTERRESLRATEEIIVTADPLSRSEPHIVQPVTVVSRTALNRTNTRNIGEAVAGELGVTAGDFGGNVGRPIIRGLSGARVRVLEDGIGTLDVSTLSPDHAVAVESAFARQVEIFRGPATLLYGSGASGGLVNVVDNRILDTVPARVRGELVAQFDTAAEGRQGAFEIEGGLREVFALHLEGLKGATDDYSIPDFAELDPDPGEPAGTLENSASDIENYSGGLSVVGDRGFVGVAVRRLEREYGVPGVHHEEEGASEPAPEGGVVIDQAQTRFDVKGELEDPLRGVTSLRTRWGFNDHRHAELEPSGEVGTLLLNNEWEGRVEAVHARLGAWDGVIGAQFQNREFDARGEEAFVPPSEQKSAALFAVEKADFGPVHLDLGARVENNEATDLRNGTDPSFLVYSLSGGINFAYAAGYDIGLAVTRAERAPSIEELFANGPHLANNTFEIGNSALASEVATNLDLIWHKTGERWALNLRFFYNDIGDFIFVTEQDRNLDGVADRVAEDFAETGELADEDALLLVNTNQGDARFWGFEFESLVTVFDGARGRLTWRLWSDYVAAQFEDGQNVPRIPPLRYGTRFAWERGPWALGGRATRVTAPDDLARLETPTSGHTLLDLYAEFTHPLAADRELALFVRGDNLLDEEIRRHTSFLKDVAPLPGISGMFGVRLRF